MKMKAFLKDILWAFVISLIPTILIALGLIVLDNSPILEEWFNNGTGCTSGGQRTNYLALIYAQLGFTFLFAIAINKAKKERR